MMEIFPIDTLLSFLNSTKPDTIWWVVLTTIVALIWYRYTEKDKVRNKNSIDKLWYRKEIAGFIKKVDDYCYNHYRDYQLYKDEAQPWSSEDISDFIDKIYFLIELHFPELIKSCEEYNEIAYEYADHCAKKGNNEKYNKKRDEFLEKMRKNVGI